MGYISVYTTLPDAEKAKEIAKTLVSERLCACANIFKVDSVYWWKGNVEEEAEYGIILKTKEDVYTKLEARIKELHPYEVPMIVTHRIDKGAESYLEWIDEEVRPFNLR
ncbi:MAG TPA: divalent-cation tolerance protein CutA [bacterium (Candidatus Stahlbacteria)]|nr:divalent-cation tolerance protein CutA [Candidatus Stahlbacteria bacterium]